ncbi:MAG: hypothetical protein JOZ63_10595 [Planctomycetaceae bacterium]|nr:hypothetical protein [Planctomycetaceae bacterium]
MVLDDGREVGIIAAFRAGSAALLAARPPRRRVGAGRVRGRRDGRRGGLGLAPEELLLAESEQGLEPVDLGLELGLAIESAAVHGLPVGGLAPRLELLLEPRTDRTGALRQGRGGTDGSGRRRLRRRTNGAPAQFRDRDPQGSETKHGGRTVIHDGRI